jgi:hypothetical protein
VSLIAALAATIRAPEPTSGGDLAPGEYGLTVEGGTVYYRVQAIRSSDLVREGVAQLVTLQGLERVASRLQAAEATPAQIEARMAALGEKAIRESVETQEAMVIAGVVALGYRAEGVIVWEEVRLVRDLAQHDPTASPPRLHLQCLPQKLHAQIAQSVRAYAGGEGAARALASFLAGGSAAAPAAGPADPTDPLADPGPAAAGPDPADRGAHRGG